VSSAFTNTGSSLVDQSMVPYQKAYAMIVFLMLLILGGNCAYVSKIYPSLIQTFKVPRQPILYVMNLHVLITNSRSTAFKLTTFNVGDTDSCGM